jgi:hypothetical protein
MWNDDPDEFNGIGIDIKYQKEESLSYTYNMKLICEKTFECSNKKCYHASSHRESCDCSRPDTCDYFKHIRCIPDQNIQNKNEEEL